VALQPIRSRDNPGYKQLKRLSESQRERNARHQSVLDGAHLLQAWLDSGREPRALWVSEAGALNQEIAGLMARVSAPCFQLPDALFKDAAPTQTPSGVLSIIDIPEPASAPSLLDTVAILDGIQDPGNVGAILRSCAAAGLREVWLTEGSAQAYAPKVLRAGMGAQFSLTLHQGVDPLAALRGFEGPVVVSALEGSDSIFDIELAHPMVWVFGSEGAGVGAGLRARASRFVRIPMPGAIESLNVSAAAAICLFEQVRRQLALGRA
jgi:TrmH family RNA methyltransferase